MPRWVMIGALTFAAVITETAYIATSCHGSASRSARGTRECV
jgi:hypothetical protein